jgi:hypothetical protein
MFPSPAQRTFKDNLTWRLIAAVPLLIMLVVAILDYSDTQKFDAPLWSITAFFALLFALACVSASKRKISVHAEGITYKSMTNEIDLRWDEITETRYGQQPFNAGVHFGLLGLLFMAAARKGDKMIRSFQIIGPRTINISSNIRDQQEAIHLVLQAVNPRFRQDAERLLRSGGTLSFGGISLTPVGVVWKSKEPIPYNAIVKCRMDDAYLRIKAEGKWLDNIAVSPKKIPNVFVLIDMIEARRGTGLGQQTTAAMAGSSASIYLHR